MHTAVGRVFQKFWHYFQWTDWLYMVAFTSSLKHALEHAMHAAHNKLLWRCNPVRSEQTSYLWKPRVTLLSLLCTTGLWMFATVFVIVVVCCCNSQFGVLLFCSTVFWFSMSFLWSLLPEFGLDPLSGYIIFFFLC